MKPDQSLLDDLENVIFLRKRESKRKNREIHLFGKKQAPRKCRYRIGHLAYALKSYTNFRCSLFVTVEALKIVINHCEGSNFWPE